MGLRILFLYVLLQGCVSGPRYAVQCRNINTESKYERSKRPYGDPITIDTESMENIALVFESCNVSIRIREIK